MSCWCVSAHVYACRTTTIQTESRQQQLHIHFTVAPQEHDCIPPFGISLSQSPSTLHVSLSSPCRTCTSPQAPAHLQTSSALQRNKLDMLTMYNHYVYNVHNLSATCSAQFCRTYTSTMIVLLLRVRKRGFWKRGFWCPGVQNKKAKSVTHGPLRARIWTKSGSIPPYSSSRI